MYICSISSSKLDAHLKQVVQSLLGIVGMFTRGAGGRGLMLQTETNRLVIGSGVGHLALGSAYLNQKCMDTSAYITPHIMH